MTVVAITGHRPEKLQNHAWVQTSLRKVLSDLSPELMYEGMAEGVDLWSARIAHELAIPYVAVRPWAGHGSAAYAEDYRQALAHAREIVNVSDSERYLGPWQYHQRNQWMVEHAELLVAVWDGKPTSGTGATVRYAKSRDLPWIWLDPVRQQVEFNYAKPEEQLPTLF